MISLTAISGMYLSGCLPSTAMPPDPSMRFAYPYAVPGAVQVPPQDSYSFGLPPTLSLHGNPWIPDVASRDWRHIVIHHTATSRGSVESIHEAHLQRKDKSGNPWMGIGYHFVIGNGNGMPDGEIEPTFRWREQLHGAHAGSGIYNQHGIGIALIGNFDEAPPTPAQLAAVKRLVSTMKTEYGISSENVVGHSDIKATACPGRFFPMADVSLGPLPYYFSGRSTGSASYEFARLEGSR